MSTIQADISKLQARLNEAVATQEGLLKRTHHLLDRLSAARGAISMADAERALGHEVVAGCYESLAEAILSDVMASMA